jgi:hypothetical protein
MRVGEVRGLVSLTLQFSDGWTAQLTPQSDGSHEARWKKGSAERTTVARVSASPSHLEVGFLPPPEVAQQDQQHAQQLMQNAFSPDLQAVLKKMQECGKLAQAEQLACIQKLQPEMMAASEANKKRLDDSNAQFQAGQPRDAWACRQVELHGPLGKLTGTAECAQPLKVTGSATCAPMPAE